MGDNEYMRSLLVLCLATGLLLAAFRLEAQDQDYIQNVTRSVAFIYDAGTDPCGAAPSPSLLPRGTGFVAGITIAANARTNPKAGWEGWKFLVTAQHVVYGQSAVILRVNKSHGSGFTCLPLPLRTAGQDQNVFTLSNRPDVDLAAMNIPDIPGADPVVFYYSLIAGDELMAKYRIREGMDVLTVGYLYGYAGNTQNFPMKRFGKIAVLTSERWYRSDRRMSIVLNKQQQDHIKAATAAEFQRLDFSPGILERGYLIEMHNNPGLSGAPVILHSPQFTLTEAGDLRYRRVPPLIVGVVKGMMLSPRGPEGVAVIEPGEHLRLLMKQMADTIMASGDSVDLDYPAKRTP
jgi:hypothetical protein